MTGILGNEWVIKEFEPFAMIPPTVRFTIYGGDASNIDMGEMQTFAIDVVRGRARVNLDRTFQIHEIVVAHRYMEENRATGKIVVLIG